MTAAAKDTGTNQIVFGPYLRSIPPSPVGSLKGQASIGVSGATPKGIDSAADLPKITQSLLDRGYSAEDIRKILGGNTLRVFREVERVSREMQAEPSRAASAR